MKDKKWDEPGVVYDQYRKQVDYKSGIGDNGLYEQDRINERFYTGDQWHGAQAGGSKPLVRYNLIKRIGDYKMAVAAGSTLSVVYSAEGIPYTAEQKEEVRQLQEQFREANNGGEYPEVKDEVQKANLVMDSLSDYFKTTAERVKFDDKKNLALRKAYVTGTGILYTYWDGTVKTGQFADDGKKSPILGDIQCEVLDVENVYFGDPYETDLQKQPYIIIAQRKSVEELKREAKRNHRTADIDNIQPDEDSKYMAGAAMDDSTANLQKCTVLTKLYKVWDDAGISYKIHAVRVTEKATIRAAWDTQLHMYPMAVMSWESAPNSIYGLSEVTNLVPNQIAINRAVTAAANAVMAVGMPKMLVNMDNVSTPINNDPGQIIPIYGSLDDCIRYVAPANFAPQFDAVIDSMISNTLSQSGANDAALGDMRPDNTSAILAVREAATMPMQLLQNRFYSFIEDLARVWADFWVSMYGQRKLKIKDEKGEWFVPFDGESLSDTIINARVDVGPASMYSEIQARQTLDNMLTNKLITPMQYMQRLPKGSIPDQANLVREMQDATNAAEDDPTAGLPDEYRQKFQQMTPEMQQMVMAQMGG